MVNVLDVPMQSRGPSNGSHNGSTTSVDSLLVFTLDPKDKYLPPGVRRAATTSAIQQCKAELAATTLRPKPRAASTDPQGREGVMRTGQLTLERQSSLLSMFHKMRQTRSAGSNAKSGLAWPRKLFSRSGSRAGQTAKEDEDDIPEVPKIPSYLPSMATTATRDAFELPIQRPETPPPMPPRAPPIPTPSAAHPASLPQSHNDGLQDQSRVGSAYLQSRENDLDPVVSAIRVSGASPSSSYFTPLQQLREHNSNFIETSATARSNGITNERINGRGTQLDVQEEQLSARNIPLQPSATNAAPLSEPIKRPNTSELLRPTSHSYAESSSSSYAISDDCSPYFDSNTTHSNPISPLHLSQPETPVTSDFEDDIPIRRNSSSLAQLTLSDNHDLDYGSIRPPSRAPPPPPPRPASKPTTAYSVLGGFHGYSLPTSENASVLTIRKLPSATFKAADTTSPFTQQGSRPDLVHSWNDGMSTLSELDVDDLGYLADVIN